MKPILEPIHVERQNTISAFVYSKKDFEMPWHFHPQHELTFIEESIGTKFIGDYVGAYEPGELILLRSNLPHCWKNYKEVNNVSKSIVIQWNKGIFAKVPELETVFEMLRTAEKGIIFNQATVELLIPLIQKLPTLFGHELYVQLLFLLIKLSESKYKTLSEKRFSDSLPTEYSDRIGKIHDFVANNFQRKIYLKELANLVNLSEQAFSRFFKKIMGRSFFIFLNEYRINIASRILIDTDLSVAEISFKCGYESLPFFHKQFNKYKKETPFKYRKRFQ